MQVGKFLLKKFKKFFDDFSFSSDIAEMASRQGLSTLASILLDLETDIALQVTVMLKLKQLDKALHKAAQSQRPDLREIFGILNPLEFDWLIAFGGSMIMESIINDMILNKKIANLIDQ